MPSVISMQRLAAELTRLELAPQRAIAALTDLDISRGKVTVFTGSPGAGKSSLIHRLLTELAARGERVGAILIDPSSPVTGGAVLGDRLRMIDRDVKDQVFLRSVAARSGEESIGTIAPVMAWTMLNHGYDHVFIESVGIGQQELDVSRRGEVLSLILGPDSGDWVQFIKSGVVDLCDVIAVTKADLDTVSLVSEIRQAVRLQSFRIHPVPVISVSSQTSSGVAELISAIDQAHEMSDERRAHSRAMVVRDILARLVIEETRKRLNAVVGQSAGGGWRDDVRIAMKFIENLPAT